MRRNHAPGPWISSHKWLQGGRKEKGSWHLGDTGSNTATLPGNGPSWASPYAGWPQLPTVQSGDRCAYSIVWGLPWESTWHGPCTGRHGSLPLLHSGRSNPKRAGLLLTVLSHRPCSPCLSPHSPSARQHYSDFYLQTRALAQ